MMTNDWRPIALLVLLLLFIGPRSPQLAVLLLGLGAWMAIRAGLAAWRAGGGLGGGTKVTYWRGRRIELPQSGGGRRATTQTLVAVLWLVLGAWMAYTVLLTFARLAAVV